MPKGNGKGKGKESDPNDRAEALLDLSISLIDQALDILNRHLKEDRQMTHSSKLMPGGSVGKHFRHVRAPIPLSCIYTDVIGDGDVPCPPRSLTTKFAFDPFWSPSSELRCYPALIPPPTR
jgi:hypothetical protein